MDFQVLVGSFSSSLVLHLSTRLPLIKIGIFSYQEIINASWLLWTQLGNCFSMRMCVTWDICGRRLISLRLTACGSRLLSNWQSSTPSLRAWARSQTWHHTHKVRRRSPERKAVCPQVCGRVTRLSNLCTFPCYPVVIRKDSTLNQPRRTLPPQLHLCFLNSIQR